MAGGRTQKRQTIKGTDIIELSLEISKWQAICCLGRTGLFPMPRRSSADPIAESLQNIFKGTFLRHVIDSTGVIGDHTQLFHRLLFACTAGTAITRDQLLAPDS